MAGFEPTTSASQRRRSTRLSYTPQPVDRSDCMTVCTDEIAFGDFSQHAPSTSRPIDQIADVGSLGDTRPVIPRHRRRVKDTATVRARTIALEVSVPLDQFAPVAAFLLESNATSAAMVCSVVFAPTSLAPCLADLASAVELVNGLDGCTATTPLCIHVVIVDTASDAKGSAPVRIPPSRPRCRRCRAARRRRRSAAGRRFASHRRGTPRR